MKAIKFLFAGLTLLTLIGLTACQKDDDEFVPGIPLENCDDTDCNDKSCAKVLPLISDIVCNIDNETDVDWYALEVSQAFVDSNFGVYTFDFSNESDSEPLKVNLFEDGIAAGDVTATGNGDLEYEPGEGGVGGIQFFKAGTYYFSVRKSGGNPTGRALYKIAID